jgi:6,7-dimethyl-8-ribityllumazine synthase
LEKIYVGPPGKRRRIAIACSEFNDEVTSKLLAGAVEALELAGVLDKNIRVVLVPGAFELPLAAQALARTKKYDAILALGAVIRGETGHYDHVCRAAEEGLMRVGLDESLPVLFGVLTCDTEKQAMARAGGKQGNKGADVAFASLHLIEVHEHIRKARR